MGWSEDAARNRDFWDRTADEYHERNAAFIEAGLAWGMWQIPEAELRILDQLDGKDVLELGCGEAEWSRALARLGARPVGLDVSPRRLALARVAIAREGLDVPLLEAPAQAVPLDDASFDIVFSDHGATGFADPYAVVPEVARLLRPAGQFAFSGLSPLSWVLYDETAERWTTSLQRDWFGLRRIEESDGAVSFALPHGEWIALFRENGLQIERLVELRPPPGARSPYLGPNESRLANRFPMEQIWVLRKS